MQRPARGESSNPFRAGVTKKFLWTSCASGARRWGLKAIDLLGVEEWEVPRRYGLIRTLPYGWSAGAA
jgi:hypothetical protein